MRQYLFVFQFEVKELYSKFDSIGVPLELVGIPLDRFDFAFIEGTNVLFVTGDDLKDLLIENLKTYKNKDAHGDVVSEILNDGVERWEYLIYEMTLLQS